jgi:hypothetical protein
LFKSPLYVDTDGYLTSTGGGTGTGGIPEAPADSRFYARYNLSWAALGTMANQNANAVAISGGSVSNITLDNTIIDGGSF